MDKYYWTGITSSPIFMGFIMELVREYHTKQVDLSGEIITVPEWTNYLTIDQNGVLTVFSHKPKFHRRDDGDDYWLNNHEEFYDVNVQFMLLDEIRARISKEEDVKDCCFYIGDSNE